MDQKLRMVNFLGQYLAASRSADQIMDMALMISQNVMGFDHAIIRLLEGDRLVTTRSVGFPANAAEAVIRLGEGISGDAALRGVTIRSDDTRDDPRFFTGMQGCRSELCAPLVYNGQTVGVFNVESDSEAFFSAQDEQVMETLASQVAAAMETTRLREELGKREKLSIVGTMASSILHDIRNDIHQLNISSDLLRQHHIDKGRIDTVAEMVKTASDNIYGLIEDIFEFVRTGESKLHKSSQLIGSLLESILESVRLSAPDNVEIKLTCADDIRLDLDRRKFRRVISNLARNAVEAMPKGGLLSVSVTGENGHVSIEIADTGVGIEEEHLGKIWEPLFTYGKKTGTGLGMAIVKKIVEDHGWTIAVRSKKGEGTLFTITA